MTAPRRLQLRRGNSTAISSYTGAAGELVVNTTDWTLYVHDGSTVGGYATTTNITSITNQISSVNANITVANLGMKGYVDSVASQSIYSNSNVKSYLTSGFDGNILPSANVAYSLGSPTQQWRDLFVSNTTIYIGGVPLSIDANGTLLVNGNVVQGAGGTPYGNSNVASYLTAESYAKTSDITTANLGLKGYVDQANTIQSSQLTSANLGIIGYVNNAVSTANIGVKGYIDLGNTIQASAITTANIGMKGYVDNQTYTNVNVISYLIDQTDKNIHGNVTIAGNLTVNGNVTYINVLNYIVGDNIINLADGNPADTLDLGFVAHRTVGGTLQHTGLIRDAGSNSWTLFSNVVPAPGATVDFTDAVYDDLRVGNITSPTINSLTLANTIQSQQIAAANIGIIGYIDSQTFYSNARVATYLQYGNPSNVSVAGNVTATYFVGNGALLTGIAASSSYSNVQTAAYLATATINTTGNITAGNLFTSGALYVANITTTGASGNISGANYITANYFVGNGALLTGITSGSNYSNVQVATYLPTYSGNIAANISKAGYTWTFGTDGTTQFPGSKILAPAGESITMQSDQYSQLMWENANLTVAPNMAINSNFYVAQNNATLDIGYRDGSGTQLIKSWYWNVDGNLKLPSGGYILNSDDSIYGAGSSYSNVEVAAYLPTYSGNVANLTLGPSGILTFADGTTQITAGGGSYSNVQVATYLPTYAGTVSASLVNTSGNILSSGLSVFGNTRIGLAGAVSGQFHTVVGNITQTSSGGAVYINTTGNVLAAAVVAGAVTTTGTMAVNSATGITTNQGTFLLANATATTINMGGAATTINLGITTSATGNVFVGGQIGSNAYNLTLRANGRYNVATSINSNGGFNSPPYANQAVIGGSGTGMTANYSSTGGYIDSLTIYNSGTGYRNGDVISVPGGIAGNSFVLQNYSPNRVGAFTGTALYTFGIDGNLTLPGNVITSSSGYFMGNAGGTTASYTGNVSAANFIGSGALLTALPGYAYSNVNVAAYLSTATINTTGNITAQNLIGNISITGNVTGTSANVTLQAGAYTSVFDNQGNVRLPTAYVTGNVTANYFIGNGALLTGIVAVSSYSNVQVATYLPTYQGNIVAANVWTTGPETGIGALSVGPALFTALPNTIAQFTGNANSYVQINFENISSGTDATADYIATANNGTDTTFFVDLGIANSNYDVNSPNNSLGTTIFPNDSYLYAQGNLATTTGGNLVIGTSTPNKTVKIFAGGINSANIVATVSNTGLVVTGNISASGNITAQYFIGNGALLTGIVASSSYSNVQVATYLPAYGGAIQSSNVQTTSANIQATTAATNTATGALRVMGGVGVAGTVFAGQLNTTGNLVASVVNAGTINSAGNVLAQNLIGTIATASQTNITAVGTLATLSVTGNATVGNLIGTEANTRIIANVYTTTFDIYGNVSFPGNVNVSGLGVTMPNRPAFRVNGTALYNGSQSTANINLKGVAVSTVYNQGSYFDAATGKFTAPVAGIYEVLLNARVNSTFNGLAQLVVLKNGLNTAGNIVAFWETTSNTAGATHFGVSGTVVLATGEYLSANILAGNVTFDQNDNWSVTYLG